MSTMELKKEGAVYILSLTNGAKANTFTEDIINEYNSVFDELEASQDNAALVITSTDPKFWSNGINLEWIVTKPSSYWFQFGCLLDKLYLRLALLNMPTIGCLNGHTYAGAAILAAAFDFRLMRADRGFFCYPEVDINIPFTPVMQQILKLLPDHQAVAELALTGRRIGGEEALKMKIVSAIYPEETLFPKALEMAQFLAQKNRKTYTIIKRGMRSNLVSLQQNLPGA
ncbi:MAG: enoyl-CoA hydratase/isomerase family protein [Deltaproteobacteria bacterium HGW-Deltaproteobacteria-12]|nr:MAG: enoyl-CoA hydratase/isomerase family protein [Deltaproteobacteria bacterium HGW-Deltaproteobacteria-12]